MKPRMTPGTVAPPEHRTDVFCSCSLCSQLAQAMANPDPDPGRGYRAYAAEVMAQAKRAIEREDEIRASGKYREGPAGEVVGLSGIGWPSPAPRDAERAAADRLADLAPDEVQPYQPPRRR